jgi:hypothetical protein
MTHNMMENPVQASPDYEDEYVRIFMRPDGIVEIRLFPRSYGPGVIYNVIDQVQKRKPHDHLLILIISDRRSSVTLKGITTLFSKRSLTYSVAKAYVISKPIHFFLSRICMRVYRPRLPLRFFNNRADAETWLKGLMGYGL